MPHQLGKVGKSRARVGPGGLVIDFGNLSR
jgi:hypothetical protein